MSDADNQVGGSGEPISKQDQGDGATHEPDSEEKTEQEPNPAKRPQP